MENTQVLEVLKTNSYPKGYAHTVYIDEAIDEPVYYRNVLNTLDTAQEGDSVRLIISTGGGLLGTADLITYAMDCCKAEITAVLASTCMSAGTIIALHAHKWEIGAGLNWMVHCGSFTVGGEAHQVQKYHDHNQALTKAMLHREYTGFYSLPEIEAISNGIDSLLMAEEVSERLENFALLRKQREDDFYQEQDDAMYEENNLMVANTLASLDVSESDKETFNRIHKMIDDSLSEQDNPSLTGEPETSVTPCEKDELSPYLVELPFLSEEGTELGSIHFYQEGGNIDDVELVLDKGVFNLSDDSILLVDYDYLDTEDRKELLDIMSKVTGRKYTKWSTDTLKTAFVREVYRQIKENITD
jgi:ATP-dependent protease ClpP protease subunit